MPFENLLHTPGVDNMPGMAQKFYFAFGSDIASWPTIPANPATAAARVNVTGNFAMVASKYFFEGYSSKDKSSLKGDGQGEVDCKSYKVAGKVFYPHLDENALAFAADAKNASGAIIMLEPNGTRILIGTELNPATFKVSVNYGDKATSEKGITIEFEADMNVPGYHYKGTIPLSATVTVPAQV